MEKFNILIIVIIFIMEKIVSYFSIKESKLNYFYPSLLINLFTNDKTFLKLSEIDTLAPDESN
jgi:hypothetical protein